MNLIAFNINVRVIGYQSKHPDAFMDELYLGMIPMASRRDVRWESARYGSTSGAHQVAALFIKKAEWRNDFLPCAEVDLGGVL